MITSRREGDESSYKDVEQLWNASSIKARIDKISSYGHRLYGRVHSSYAWDLTDAAKPEEPSQPLDRRVCQYLLEFLERDGVERRFSELLGMISWKEITRKT